MDTVVIDEGALLEAVPVSTRKEVGQKVLPYYDRLVELQADNAAARAGVAKTLLYRARLKHAVGTTEEDEAAVADCLRAAQLYAEAAPTLDNKHGRARGAGLAGRDPRPPAATFSRRSLTAPKPGPFWRPYSPKNPTAPMFVSRSPWA